MDIIHGTCVGGHRLYISTFPPWAIVLYCIVHPSVLACQAGTAENVSLS